MQSAGSDSPLHSRDHCSLQGFMGFACQVVVGGNLDGALIKRNALWDVACSERRCRGTEYRLPYLPTSSGGTTP